MSDTVIRNAWVVRAGLGEETPVYSAAFEVSPSAQVTIEQGDGVLWITEEGMAVHAIGRVYRVRHDHGKAVLLFDGVEHPATRMELTTSGIVVGDAHVARIEWGLFDEVVRDALGYPFADLPVLAEGRPGAQAYVRDLLSFAAIDDLLGPADGPEEEIVGMSVRDRYLVGKLAPMEPTGAQATALPFADDDISMDKSPVDLEVYANSDHIGIEKTPSGPVDDEQEPEIGAAGNQSLVPSAMGVTVCVNGQQQEVEVTATWGRYGRRPDLDRIEEKTRIDKKTNQLVTYTERLRVWKRTPSGGTRKVSLKSALIPPTVVDEASPSVVIQGAVSGALNDDGDRLVTLFLVNTQEKLPQNQDQAWVFQPEIVVRDSGGAPVFRRRPILRDVDFDEERQGLEMIYRHRVEFATGHGTSVHAQESPGDSDAAIEIRTTAVPEYEVPITEAPGRDARDRPSLQKLVTQGFFDMSSLGDPARLDKQTLVAGLVALADDYETWISENVHAIGLAVVGHDAAAQEAMARCSEVLARLREGIATLDSDEKALDAFRFANQAMAAQRVRGIYAREHSRGGNVSLGELDVPKNRSWHPFQLAFLLLSIPALADPMHADRTQPLDAHADLLWFPTGGGKTEAYLGVAAFTMAIRRLQGALGGVDSARGLAVIMRYTLRLLTLQQFQRATTLICSMELLRRAESQKWGRVPFTIGLWVGQRTTPNTTSDSHIAIQKERDGKFGTGSTPAQLTSCPWCGSEIKAGRDIDVNRETGQTAVYCGALYDRCEFNRSNANGSGLPVSVVDEELYHRPPSMLIATVDKFAQMAWKGQVRALFGKADLECPRHGLLWPNAKCTGNHPRKAGLPSTKAQPIKALRPPDLIIQDEFHLISGPLGTMVGLYEAAVDELCAWPVDGKKVRAKIIASTATVRKAGEQVNNVFLRQVAVFPPHGLDVEDNFFAVQRPIAEKPGRLYLGICAPGSSRPAVLIRVYVALLTGAKELFNHFGVLADPYMTLVGYFNSLRELGGMRRLAEDDVQTRAYRVQMGHVSRPGLAQRSVPAVDELTSRVTNKDIPKKLQQLEVHFKREWAEGESRPIDIVLATNMLSVGVDVNRLGLMVVNGQPKNTAEYIQATSRVGRAFPGLVFTVQTWSRPRDLSHYETFEHYHATFYKHVEAQSVTPFSARALDRGLTGTFVSLMRLANDELNPNLGAQLLDKSGDARAAGARTALSDRAWLAKSKEARTLVEHMVADRIDRWVKEASASGRRLGYETERGQGDIAALLKKAGAATWDEFTVPMSMREVEPAVQLIMDGSIRSKDQPAWRFKPSPAADGSDA